MTHVQDDQPLPDSDRERQIFVTLATVFCLLSALVGLGVLGSPIDEVAGGALASDATLVAPARWAFLLWRPIYLGMIAYTIVQWLPGEQTRQVHREIGWLAGWSMILAGAWVLVAQREWLWLGVLFLFATLVVLALINLALARHRDDRRTLVTWLATDVTFGVYLGWSCIATIAMITATLRSVYITYGLLDPFLALAVLMIGAGVGIRLALHTHASLSILFGFLWGYAGIAWARSFGELQSTLVAAGAVIAAVTLVAGTLAVRWAMSRPAQAVPPAAGDLAAP